jgi:hypothetical protein
VWVSRKPKPGESPTPTSRLASTMAGMGYAVTWSDAGGPVFAGSLDVARTAFVLVGTAPPGLTSRLQVLAAEVVALRIERRPENRLKNRPTLVVERRGGAGLSISALAGAGLLSELAAALASICAERRDGVLAEVAGSSASAVAVS